MKIEIDSRESAARNFGIIPVVTNLTAQKGPAGTVFNVIGSGFSPTAANNTVRFVTSSNNVTASIGTASAGSLQITAPGNMTFNQNVTVTVAGRTSTETRYFVGIPNVTNFAGSVNNPGDEVSPGELFDNPFGIDINSAGHFFVSDGDNNKIREITSAGTVTTFYGSGEFSNPRGIAIDASDRVLVADFNNNAIKRISADGSSVSVLDAPGDGYSSPRAVAVNKSNGIIYVADTGNNRIVKIQSGTASVLATGFNEPFGIDVHPDGDIYVADRATHVIRRVTPGGSVSTFAGSLGNSGSSDGIGSAARFFQPEGIDIDADGNIYISDTDNCQIRLIDPNGRVTTLAGSGNRATSNGQGLAAEFNEPDHLVFRAPDDLYVVEFDAHVIRHLAP
jgi:streptogramin lyase